jgi:hypothetical protein
MCAAAPRFIAQQQYRYLYMYIHIISMSTFKRLNRFDFEIHKVGHQERLTVDGDDVSH